VILGVLLLVFRRPVSAFLTRTFGRLTYANPTLPMTLVILAGVFLIVVAGGLLASAVVTAVTS
jgi:hypothetical protein